jgi:single-stranded-DNA-specific exonuclease
MKWHIKEKVPKEFIKKFPEYPSIVLQLLYDRGLDTQGKIDEFFNPDYSQDLHDPFLMLGMKQAVARIKKAIKKKEKIAVFADYDCDGVCAGVILETTLRKLGANLGDIYIPDRHKEGFGLNKKAIEEFKEKKVDLIITVDCGINNHEEVRLAKSLGMEVIITDHHRIISSPPETIVVDPHQKGEKYPFKDLSGAGVTFKFIQGLLKKCKSDMAEGWEKWLLDLVALATVADMVSLLGENRTLVRYGLVVMAQTRRPGIKELMRVAGLKPVLERKKIPTTEGISQLISRIETGRYSFMTNLRGRDLGFILAPRINVASSLAHANIAYELLATASKEEAKLLAEKLNNINEGKYKIINEVVGDIEKRLMEKGIGKIIFEASDKWPAGVIRWAAQKFRDKYSRPVFIFNITDGKVKGSIRSVPQFNIVKAMEQCSGLLEKFGGHPAAAGCRLSAEKLDDFRVCLEKIVDEKLKDEDLSPSIEIDCEIKPEEINWQIYDSVRNFAPFGKNNPSPLFLLSGAKISDMRMVGNGNKHLKLELAAGDKKFKAIGFNHGIKFENFKINDKVDIVFEFLVNEWNGTRELELKIIDMKATPIHE